mgnify:CR=1 FL=1
MGEHGDVEHPQGQGQPHGHQGGHAAGDELLRLAAKRLREAVRRNDIPARLGGDEFLVVSEDLARPEDAEVIAHKVARMFQHPFQVEQREVFATTSVGIAVFPQDGETADGLLRSADTAMYHAKAAGKNKYRFFTRQMQDTADRHLAMETELRHALARRELRLMYQPKYDSESGRIRGAEALLRWQHPERGLIGPEGFIGALEECGLMLPVGKWVLDTACAQAQAWRRQGIPPIQMSVNLSGQQITDSGLLRTVTESCDACGFNPQYLELELTEGFIMQRRDEVIELLTSLRERGMSIAIDDFGTGYSSLSYLKQLPIQTLKIDRSFVRDIPADPDDAAITSAIVALGHRLQMSIVAEGVETEEQLAFLAGEGCQEAQGFLVS